MLKRFGGSRERLFRMRLKIWIYEPKAENCQNRIPEKLRRRAHSLKVSKTKKQSIGLAFAKDQTCLRPHYESPDVGNIRVSAESVQRRLMQQVITTQLEEHSLFVLHPMWAEKGDLL